MKAYLLKETCPYYGDEEDIGIYTTTENVEKAKEIKARCSRINNYDERFSVDEIELDKMPWDCDKEEK